MSSMYKVDHSALEDYCQDIFKAVGLDDKDAAIVAESLVDADLRNVISHGVTRVGNYMDRLKNGGTNPHPNITVVQETGTTALIDGDDCLGSLISEQAVALARKKASDHGLGCVCVRRSTHYGAAARWSLKLAGDDMIGFTGSNVEPLMCVTGSNSKGIGNNPFSFAFPTGSYGPICLDVACSMMAGGKLFEYKRENKPLPVGCFLDADGHPATDPNQADVMKMLPFGGHKGYGLAVAVEMLSSILSGGKFGSDMGSQYNLLGSPNHIAHFFFAMRIDAFRPIEEYKKSADAFVDYLHALPRQEGVEQIYVPGELENKSKADKLANGLRYSCKQIDELEDYGRRAGLSAERAAFLREFPID